MRGRHRGGLVVGAVVAGGLLLTGCSEPPTVCDTKPAAPHVAGTTRAVAVTPRNTPPVDDLSEKRIDALLPPEDPHASLMDGIERNLMHDTVRMAGALGDVRAGTCHAIPPAANDGASQRCTVRYEGVDAVWNVTLVKVDAGPMTTARYRTVPVRGVLTDRAVYAAAGWHGGDPLQRCDRLPRLIRVDGVGKPTRYRCQTRSDSCDSTKGGWRFGWLDFAVTIDEHALVDFVAARRPAH